MSEEKSGAEQPSPRMLSHYQLLEQIGQGGMAVVFKGVQPSLNREVAIKILPKRFAESEDMVARFDREASIVAQLKHPSIVQIIDRGKEGDELYIVMEYVAGESLDKTIARGTIPLPDVVEYSIQVCEALQYAHDKGVIHRDLKPANILLDEETGRAKIADFGIAQIETEGIGMPTLTCDSTSLGTMSYMSPEQRLDAHAVTYHTDIFALGVVLYEMLTGKVPIGHFKLPSLLRTDIPIGLDNIVTKCLAQSPADRYQSADEVRDEIARLTGRYRKLRKAPRRPTRRTKGRGGKKALAAVCVALLVVIGGAAALLVAGRSGQDQKPPVEDVVKPETDIPPLTPDTPPVKPPDEVQPPAEPDGADTGRVGAAEVLTAALVALDAGNTDGARQTAERLLAEFPDSDQAGEARKLIEQIEAQRLDKELAEAVAKAHAMVAVPDAAEEDYTRALAFLAETAPRFPGRDERIAEGKQKITARWQAAYDEALARGKAAQAAGRWDEATAAFMQAHRVRADKEIERCLSAVKQGKELADFAAAPDSRTRTRHLALYLATGRAEAAAELVPKAQALRAMLEEIEAARKEADLFRDKMDAAGRSSLGNGETDFAQGEQSLKKLDPARLTGPDLTATIATFQLALAGYRKAVGGTVKLLYPGLDSQSPAARLLAAYEARRDQPDSATVSAAYAKVFADERFSGVVKMLSDAKGKISPGELAAHLGRTITECDRLAEAGADVGAVRSLKCMALVLRAGFLAGEGQAVEGLRDAAAAAELQQDAATEQVLKASADALAGELRRSADDPAKAAALIRKAAPVLASQGAAPARSRVAEAAADPALAAVLTAQADLARVWEKSVGPFTPPGMVRVRGGEFPLGVAYTGLKALTPNSAPRHEVVIGEFCMDVCEVTNAQFAAFVRAGGYGEDAYWVEAPGVDRSGFTDAEGKPGPEAWHKGACPEGSANQPVVGISWYEAAAYARWAGKRLPTEAEWECAGTAVFETADGVPEKRKFPWGDAYVKGRAHLSDSGKAAASDVGSWPDDKSASGCCDMLGSVREWTASPYAAYPGSACQDRKFGAGMVVLRGRCFADSQIGAELTNRRAMDKGGRDSKVGFRCAWCVPAE